jgi:hypothetical protein
MHMLVFLFSQLLQAPKIFLYGSPNSAATYANSIIGYTGPGKLIRGINILQI